MVGTWLLTNAFGRTLLQPDVSMHLPSRWPDQPCSHHPNRDHPPRVICRTPEKFWDESGFKNRVQGLWVTRKIRQTYPRALGWCQVNTDAWWGWTLIQLTSFSLPSMLQLGGLLREERTNEMSRTHLHCTNQFWIKRRHISAVTKLCEGLLSMKYCSSIWNSINQSSKPTDRVPRDSIVAGQFQGSGGPILEFVLSDPVWPALQANTRHNWRIVFNHQRKLLMAVDPIFCI